MQAAVRCQRRIPPLPHPPLPGSPIERLKMTWDSEGDAYWPAAKTLAALSEKSYQAPVDAEESIPALGFRSVRTMADHFGGANDRVA